MADVQKSTEKAHVGASTWDAVLRAAEQAMQELRVRIDCDPRHGAFYQQMLAVMWYRRQEASAAKRQEEEAMSPGDQKESAAPNALLIKSDPGVSWSTGQEVR